MTFTHARFVALSHFFVLYFQLSWADFVLVGIVETVNLYAGTDTEQPYPTIQALFQKIRNLPGVKEYIAKRTTYTISI